MHHTAGDSDIGEDERDPPKTMVFGDRERERERERESLMTIALGCEYKNLGWITVFISNPNTLQEGYIRVLHVFSA